MASSRRRFLALTALAPVAVLGIASARAQGGACYDPEALPLSQKNRRRSLRYVDVSSDPARRCGGCAFFTAGEGGCGACQLLSGGPVSREGVCASFAAKAQ